MHKKTLFGLVGLSVIGLLLWTKKSKASTNNIIGFKPKTIPNKTNQTGAKATSNDNGYHILTEAEIKRYATWIDRIEQLTAPLMYSPGMYQLDSAEALGNLKVLLDLDDYNLRLVVQYWQKVRNRKINQHNTFKGFTVDSTGLVAQFKNRI